MLPTINQRSGMPSFIDQLFDNDDIFGNFFDMNRGINMPATNVYETNEAYVLEVAVPGLAKEDVALNIEKDNVLSISAEKGADEKNYLQKEFDYRSFRRTFSLPEEVDTDNILATYEKGVLSINLPKKEVRRQTAKRQIEIE